MRTLKDPLARQLGGKSKKHIQRVMHSSDRSDWRTPRPLFEALHREFRFTCDLAADAQSTFLPRWFGSGGIQEDALDPDLRWTGRGFLNPPYSVKRAKRWREDTVGDDERNPYEIANWLRKAHIESARGWIGVTVIPFSPQTIWYRCYIFGHRHLVPAMTPIRFHSAVEERKLPHRVTFLRPDGSTENNAPGNTVIIVWRPNPGYVGPWGPVSRYWDYPRRPRRTAGNPSNKGADDHDQT